MRDGSKGVGDSRRGGEKNKKAKQKHRGHEYGMCVSCDLNIHDMTISMS